MTIDTRFLPSNDDRMRDAAKFRQLSLAVYRCVQSLLIGFQLFLEDDFRNDE